MNILKSIALVVIGFLSAIGRVLTEERNAKGL